MGTCCLGRLECQAPQRADFRGVGFPSSGLFRVSGFSVLGLGFRIQGFGFRVQGLGFRVQRFEFRVYGGFQKWSMPEFWVMSHTKNPAHMFNQGAYCRLVIYSCPPMLVEDPFLGFREV